MARGWQYTKLFFYDFSGMCFVFIVPFFLSFLFCFCSHARWRFEDAPLMFSCPEDHVLDGLATTCITGYG